ncbi:MAG: hypothetical protein IPN59_16915 [Holophaga sp.]|nr:hypothetical protein [Holophaga sp.]
MVRIEGHQPPDDMSGNILEALWCDLNGQQFSLEAKAKVAAAMRREMKTPDKPICPTCTSKVKFTKWVLHKYSPTNFVSFHYAVCEGADKHVWLWNRVKGYRTYTDEKFKLIGEAPEAFGEGAPVE